MAQLVKNTKLKTLQEELRIIQKHIDFLYDLQDNLEKTSSVYAEYMFNKTNMQGYKDSIMQEKDANLRKLASLIEYLTEQKAEIIQQIDAFLVSGVQTKKDLEK